MITRTDKLGKHKMLILTVGLPYSGKSTTVKGLNYPIVNPDSIRMSIHGQPVLNKMEPYVWATTKIMIESLFLAGHDKVILDATNITIGRRSQWKSKNWSISFYYANTSKEECIKRAENNNDENMINVIKRMSKSFEYLNDDEQKQQIFLR